MLTCPNPPAVTLVMDPRDDVAHTRAALAAHNPSEGRVTIHPTPGTDSTLSLAYDILAALGKPVPLTGYPASDPRPAWTLCSAWILALPITCLTVLRAHLLDSRCLGELMALRARAGLRLALVCHHRKTPAALERALSRTDYQLADADAVLSYEVVAAEGEDSPPAALSRRWINLPALTTLQSIDDSDRCSCLAPAASERGFTPPALTALTQSQVARRLHAATAHGLLHGRLRDPAGHRPRHRCGPGRQHADTPRPPERPPGLHDPFRAGLGTPLPTGRGVHPLPRHRQQE